MRLGKVPELRDLALSHVFTTLLENTFALMFNRERLLYSFKSFPLVIFPSMMVKSLFEATLSIVFKILYTSRQLLNDGIREVAILMFLIALIGFVVLRPDQLIIVSLNFHLFVESDHLLYLYYIKIIEELHMIFENVTQI